MKNYGFNGVGASAVRNVVAPFPDKRDGKFADMRMPLVARPLSSMAVEKGTETDTTPCQCGHGHPLSNALSAKRSRQQHGFENMMLENRNISSPLNRNENAILSYRICWPGSTAVYIRLNSIESSRKTGSG